MTKILLIGAGGGAGALLRYFLSGWTQSAWNGSFPTGTLLVNALGCLAIGFLGAAFSGPILIREEYRLALMVGLLGGLTTFSSYGWETVSLANDGQRWWAAVNIVASNALALAAVLIGYRLAERVYGA